MTGRGRASFDPDVALRKIRTRALDQPDEPWSALFLDLDAWLAAGKRLPAYWRKCEVCE